MADPLAHPSDPRPVPLASGLFDRLNPIRPGAASMGKLAFIGILLAVLLIPMEMVQSLIRERSYLRSSAAGEVIGKWGGSQRVTGPILTVPYQVITPRSIAVAEKGKEQTRTVYDTTVEYAHFLPAKLAVKGNLVPEVRHRGIYDVALFKADLKLQGRFAQPDFSTWRVPAKNILWADAFVSLDVPDVRTLSGHVPLSWRGGIGDLEPDLQQGSPVAAGLHRSVALSAEGPGPDGYAFELAVKLNGSEAMNFLPMGKETRIELASAWRSPSFTGAFLPQESQVDAAGFMAAWTTSHLNRAFPQSWRGAEIGEKDWSDYAFGVNLFLPVDHYQQTTRCAKYAILFSLLTFLVFFMNETFDKRRIHPLQYLLVGCALCLFYVLLLAFTEHIPFLAAYVIAAGGVVGMITAYGAAVLSGPKRAFALGATLAGLYVYLYTLLQMEDFALLGGSLGLFAILAGVMYLTRRLNRAAAPVAA